MRNIAFIGPQKSGKSTLAMMLMEKQGYERVGIADEIKHLAGKAFPSFDKDDMFTIRTFGGEQPISGRELLQEIGGALREVDRDFWLKCFSRKYANGISLGNMMVVDDVRLEREAAYLRHIDPTILIVRVTASPLVREQRSFGRLKAAGDITEIGWNSVDPDFAIDTTDMKAEDAYQELVGYLEGI
jgi:hypothetical protein